MKKIIDKYEKYQNANLLDKLFEQYHFEDIVSYLNDYKKQNEKVANFILEYMKYLKKESENTIYGKYLNSIDADKEIVQIINLLNSNNPDKLTILVNYSFKKDQFENIIKKFKNLFPQRTNDLNYIISLYKQYEKIEEEIYNDKCLMLDIFESNYCIDEYCSYTGYSISEINQALSNLWNTKNKKYKKTMEYIRKRSTIDFYKKVNEIANYIYLKDNFDIFDYYECTKMEMRHFTNVIDRAIENKEIKQKVISKINYIYLRYKTRNAMIVCDKTEFEVLTKINNKIITKEEKEKIFEYMKINRMHKHYFIYRECLIKYANGELDLDKMQYVRKKGA